MRLKLSSAPFKKVILSPASSQNWACFMRDLKIINTFLKNNVKILTVLILLQNTNTNLARGGGGGGGGALEWQEGVSGSSMDSQKAP